MNEESRLKILFIEDMLPDFELAENELVKNDISFVSLRVENSRDFEDALHEFIPDIVISDYSLPQFNGMLALKISRDHDPLLPFIVLTGTLNEEIAVECMKAGADDYVIKEHISRLSFAVRDAVLHRDILREKLTAEASLLESESRYRSMFENNCAVMLLVDPRDGSIVDANPAASEYYRYARSSLISKKIPDISTAAEETLNERMGQAIAGNKNHFISKHMLADCTVRDVEIFGSPVNYRGRKLVHFIIQDITERNRAIEALQKSLDEKKELIKEIQHRTKNNMQVIISMLTLKSVSAGDEKLEKILMDMENRIRAMSLVHEKLYQSRSISKLGLRDYLAELIHSILSGYGITEEKIGITLEMEDFEVLIDTAIPCGLVVNELVTNVAKHAFPGESSGNLFLGLSMDSTGDINLTVADNGAGKGIDPGSIYKKSMGLQIVRSVVEYQMKGVIRLDSSSGLKWTVIFRDNLYEERI